MKIQIGIAILALAGAAIAAVPPEVVRLRHVGMEGHSSWHKCQVSDLVGLATLVKFDPAQTNEVGVEAIFKFTDRMAVEFVPSYRNMGKADSGEYVVTIPATLKDPGDTSWRSDYESLPWNWKESETYVCLCRSEFNHGNGTRTCKMIWVLPGSRWGAFKEEVQEERAAVEPYVKAKKQELRALKDEFRAIWSRADITEAEAEALSLEPRKRNIELRKELEDWGAQNKIQVKWSNLDTTWP